MSVEVYQEGTAARHTVILLDSTEEILLPGTQPHAFPYKESVAQGLRLTVSTLAVQKISRRIENPHRDVAGAQVELLVARETGYA